MASSDQLAQFAEKKANKGRKNKLYLEHPKGGKILAYMEAGMEDETNILNILPLDKRAAQNMGQKKEYIPIEINCKIVDLVTLHGYQLS